MNQKVRLVVPEAPSPQAVAVTATRAVAKGGIRLGVLDNSKGNADHLLKFIIDGVKAMMPVASVVALRKDSVSLPAPDAILDQLAAESDYVVTAMADWGSCTSWSVHDMANLQKRGLKTAVICSGPFLKLGQAQARVFGVPDLPLLVIPHPLGGISIDQVKARAEHALPLFARVLKENTQ